MDIGQVLVGIADAMATAEATDAAARTVMPEIPKGFDLTRRVLIHMMRENTGVSILDSGGAYGRAWQRNQGRPFWEAPRATVEFRAYHCTYGKNAGKVKLETNVTIDVFHFLSEKVEYDRALTRQFRKFAALPENEDESWLENMEKFPAWIAEKRAARCDQDPSTFNSYNEECMLSQTLQGTIFWLDHEQYVILQVHGGADIRGGYTAPKVFRLTDEWSVCEWNRATIYPDHKEVAEIQKRMREDLNRQTFLFPEVEADVRGEVESLGDDTFWDVGSFDDHGEACEDLASYPVLEVETRDQWVRGAVCVLPDHSALCPLTGARLLVDFM